MTMSMSNQYRSGDGSTAATGYSGGPGHADPFAPPPPMLSFDASSRQHSTDSFSSPFSPSGMSMSLSFDSIIDPIMMPDLEFAPQDSNYHQPQFHYSYSQFDSPAPSVRSHSSDGSQRSDATPPPPLPHTIGHAHTPYAYHHRHHHHQQQQQQSLSSPVSLHSYFTDTPSPVLPLSLPSSHADSPPVSTAPAASKKRKLATGQGKKRGKKVNAHPDDSDTAVIQCRLHAHFQRTFSTDFFATYISTITRIANAAAADCRTFTPERTADIAYSLAMMRDFMNEQNFRECMSKLEYTESDDRSVTDNDGSQRRCYRSSHCCLPYLTLPLRSRPPFQWAPAPDYCFSDDVHKPSFAQLSWYRSQSLRFYHRANQSTVQVCDFQSLPSDAVVVPISAVDLGAMSLPMHARVNSAFERLFGYSQLEIQSRFLREGKYTMVRLMAPEQFQSIVSKDAKQLFSGHTESNHFTEAVNRYGHRVPTLMHHRVGVNDQGFVVSHHWCWIPLPSASPVF